MAEIYKTTSFIVESHERPFVSRTDGGHIRIKVKDKSIIDRTRLSPKQAIKLMRLTIIIGDALKRGMRQQGVPVVKVNYQDMGNWAFKQGEQPYLHIHVFGRSETATTQIFPEAVYLPDRSTGFYDNFEPLSKGDIQTIKKLINASFESQTFSDSTWRLE